MAEDFDRYSLKYYDFPNIIKVLSEFSLERDFIQIPIFDALIANQDRHCDNWGIIVYRAGYQLAPIYDNGASLGYQLQEERILKMFQDQRMFTAFTNRSYSLIGLPDKKKPKYRELLNFIYQLYPQETKEMVERISQINEKQILVILNEISEEAMSKVLKRMGIKIITISKRVANNWYTEGK
ncbi:HipA domain-containing protein [Aeribacillus composti]|uniref:HipA domain-containing protein n=3 Tax=Aeribacillus TaxID=1055323 RepID=UPI003D1DE5B9